MWGGILVTMVGCEGTKKITIPAPDSLEPIPWTTRYQDSCKFSDETIKEIDFYNSLEIKMAGEFFSRTSLIENGVVVIIDTSQSSSRTIFRRTVGKIIGTPQKEPGAKFASSMQISFDKNGIAYNFQFDRMSDGTYALNKKGEVVYEGKKYAIFVNYSATQYEPCRLLFKLRRMKVVINDNQ
jgi:hypothetical protein